MKTFKSDEVFKIRERETVYMLKLVDCTAQGEIKKKEIIMINNTPYVIKDIELQRTMFGPPINAAVLVDKDVTVKHDDVVYNLTWPECVIDNAFVQLTDDKVVPIGDIQIL